MRFIKKLLVILLLIGLVGCKTTKPVVIEEVEDNQEFNDFLDREFVDSMEADYLSMHYTVEDYGKYNIEKPEPTLGDITLESYEDDVEDAKSILSELEAFDYDSLSSSQKVTYSILKRNLENYIVINSYPMLDDFFKPNGLNDNLITNFVEFEFRSEEDIEDYLQVLESAVPFMESAIKLTREKAEKGYFISESAVEYVVESIDRFVSKVEDNELIIDFNSEMEKMDIDSGSKQTFIDRNKEIVVNGIIPVYQNIKDTLVELNGSRSINGGVALYEGGRAYFEALIKEKASNDLSLEDQIDMAADFLVSEIRKIQKLYQSNPEAFDSDIYSKVAEAENVEDFVEFIRSKMDASYPQGPEVKYEISYLDESIANESILAYYLNPPIDNVVKNIIKVNPKSSGEPIRLYTTIAHEGFPGHLYQITYFLNTNPHPIRSTISNIGYTEGWAMYTETMSSFYLEELTDAESELYNLDIEINYVLSAAVDIGVNGLGWSVEDTSEWLEQFGFDDYAEVLYDSAIMMPASLVPYGYGLIQFLTLRNDAEERLGNKFDEIEFNKVLLDNGDRSFELVKEDVEAYIKSKK